LIAKDFNLSNDDNEPGNASRKTANFGFEFGDMSRKSKFGVMSRKLYNNDENEMI